ncbi:MAG: metallophosphoesterase [Planctomycetes bacterium]|nr:metallophosphoesterase [Planctomycetota bacterium]
MYDLIGDIHGHADKLVQLLETLGYRDRNGRFVHSERQVIFLGDFIDRGPKIFEVLQIVRGMVDAGSALAIMGNHEWNSLAFHTRIADDHEEYVRPRREKNIRQHYQTLTQVTGRHSEEALAWYRTLPLWLDLDGLRAVHACWDPPSMQLIEQALQEHGGLTDSFLRATYAKNSPLFKAVEIVLKGKEARLPAGAFFLDKESTHRHQVRTRWWLPAEGQTYGSYAFQTDPIVCDVPLCAEVIAEVRPYPSHEKPVFMGHYWLSVEKPFVLAPNIACLDFSVAKDGFLCAYRWKGERVLNDDHFVVAPAVGS